jgi:hypothetical protein
MGFTDRGKRHVREERLKGVPQGLLKRLRKNSGIWTRLEKASLLAKASVDSVGFMRGLNRLRKKADSHSR